MASSRQNTSRQRKPRTEIVIVFSTEHDAACAKQMMESRGMNVTLSRGFFEWFVSDIPQQHVDGVLNILKNRGVACYRHTWEHRVIKKGDA